MKAVLLVILCISVGLVSCKKDSFITSPDANLSVNTDTLKFDTVFVTAGSVTKSFKIINDNDQKILLSSVRLMGGVSSVFKINVDGTPGPELDNIEIAANDSIYVFAQVNVDPSTSGLPFILSDSIELNYNGNKRFVQLQAWGQNAHFLRNTDITTNVAWNNDLPYVILGYLHVAAGKQLLINNGCRIYVHADAPILVDGSLQVSGGSDSAHRVYFQGDRLDDPYRDYPASWPGIFFSASSQDNVFQYAVIKNSYQSLAVEGPSVNANPKLILRECIIDNSYDAGIIASHSSISARNCLISNCGKNITLIAGGVYQFVHCTAASYSNEWIPHRSPVLTISNTDGISTADLNALFQNCIFWGDNGLVGDGDEVAVNKVGTGVFNVNFDHVLWKLQNTPANVTGTQLINGMDPLFDSVNTVKNYYSFRLQAGSPAIDKGVDAGVSIDLDGLPRPVGSLPDLGCYERQ